MDDPNVLSQLNCVNNAERITLKRQSNFKNARFEPAQRLRNICFAALSGNSQSGKVNRKIKLKNNSKAGQIFREAARSLLQSKTIAIGAFMRRVRSRKGAPIAIKAGARKIAMAYYNIITKGQQYVEVGIKNYETKLKARDLNLLTLLADKHNIQLNFNH